jgi:hypothetical protein
MVPDAKKGLPSLTRGEAVWLAHAAGDRPVPRSGAGAGED